MTIKPIQNEKSILAGIKKDYDPYTPLQKPVA